MSEAYQSTLRISFDVRGGLADQAIHHWAADLFVHRSWSTCCGSSSPVPSASRARSTADRITLFALALIEGLFGYSLPDDQLSGAGLRIFEGTLQGIPIVAPTCVLPFRRAVPRP